MAAPIFTSTCDSFTGFDSGAPYNNGTGTTLTISSTAARNPSAASPNGFLLGLNTTGSFECGMRIDQRGSGGKNIVFDMFIPTATTISAGDTALVHMWDASYADTLQARIQSVDGNTKLQMFFINDFTTFPTLFTVPDHLSKNTWYTIWIQITNNYIVVRINGRLAARHATTAYSAKEIGVAEIGAFYACNLTGNMYLDNITLDTNANIVPAPATDHFSRLTAVAGQYKTDFLRSDGMPIRPYPDGVDGSFAAWSDSTSETIDYMQFVALQTGDQTRFDLVSNVQWNTMRRGAQGLGTVPNLTSWHWDIGSNTAYDQNTAHDADIKIAANYAQAHMLWSSKGAIDYKSRAVAMSVDLIGQTYVNGTFRYLPSDYTQGLSTPFEVNLSYYDPLSMELLALIDKDNYYKWKQTIDGFYDMLAIGIAFVYSPQASSAGLPPNWGTFNPSTRSWAAGSRGTPDVYSYEAFRLMWRLKLHAKHSGDARATSSIKKMRDFMSSYWITNGSIAAEYKHDGTLNGGAYEKTIFTYAAWQALTAANPQDANAKSIYDGKLANIYAATERGHIYHDTPASGLSSYYDQSWTVFGEMERLNQLFIARL